MKTYKKSNRHDKLYPKNVIPEIKGRKQTCHATKFDHGVFKMSRENIMNTQKHKPIILKIKIKVITTYESRNFSKNIRHNLTKQKINSKEISSCSG